MSVLKNLGNLFKTTEELKQEERARIRKMERAAENVVDRIKDRIADLKKDAQGIWAEARTALQNGQKAEATSLLRSYKARSVMITRYDHQKIFAENQLTMIQGAVDIKELSASLKGLVAAQNLNPDEIAMDLGTVADAAADIKDINKMMDKEFEKDQARLIAEAEGLADPVADAELMKALESEVSAQILGDKVVGSKAPANPQTSHNLQALTDRAAKL